MKITFNEVTKRYGDVVALEKVTLEIAHGETFGLVGPNGSGKSTLMRLLLGIIKPTEGSVLFDGVSLDEKGWIEIRRQIGYMPERVSFYDNLTGFETLQHFARIKGGGVSNIKDVLGKILADEALRRRVGGYSKGMRQRINLAQALLNNPALLVLDEPTSGLDPVGVRELYGILDELKSVRNMTIVLSSHILAEIEEKVQRVGIMKEGNIKATGSLEELYRGFNLPLRLVVMLREDGDKRIVELLKAEGLDNIAVKDGSLVTDLPRDKKMRVLSCILEHKDSFSDFTVREPSLEEVFFGIH
ncbi:MAG: ABC transporter ATP-binding protein [Nitrospirae bacterium]|nr:ABC transporter ATP-binding protein [Nitrospirota bacterium]MBF0534640.1 ABC transporter ATP-binding protein [Nitrospirota bacterium]MBF0616316.1 ABC transporter ATP-binding protein [Nitrospirota bacterium]